MEGSSAPGRRRAPSPSPRDERRRIAGRASGPARARWARRRWSRPRGRSPRPPTPPPRRCASPGWTAADWAFRFELPNNDRHVVVHVPHDGAPRRGARRGPRARSPRARGPAPALTASGAPRPRCRATVSKAVGEAVRADDRASAGGDHEAVVAQEHPGLVLRAEPRLPLGHRDLPLEVDRATILAGVPLEVEAQLVHEAQPAIVDLDLVARPVVPALGGGPGHAEDRGRAPRAPERRRPHPCRGSGGPRRRTPPAKWISRISAARPPPSPKSQPCQRRSPSGSRSARHTSSAGTPRATSTITGSSTACLLVRRAGRGDSVRARWHTTNMRSVTSQGQLILFPGAEPRRPAAPARPPRPTRTERKAAQLDRIAEAAERELAECFRSGDAVERQGGSRPGPRRTPRGADPPGRTRRRRRGPRGPLHRGVDRISPDTGAIGAAEEPGRPEAARAGHPSAALGASAERIPARRGRSSAPDIGDIGRCRGRRIGDGMQPANPADQAKRISSPVSPSFSRPSIFS